MMEWGGQLRHRIFKYCRVCVVGVNPRLDCASCPRHIYRVVSYCIGNQTRRSFTLCNRLCSRWVELYDNCFDLCVNDYLYGISAACQMSKIYQEGSKLPKVVLYTGKSRIVFLVACKATILEQTRRKQIFFRAKRKRSHGLSR